MKVVCDIETNSLINPRDIWVIVCKDIDTGEFSIFREVTRNEDEKKRFLSYARDVELWIGHNWLEYDYPILSRLLGLDISNVADCSLDTLILSRLIDYSRAQGHSIDAYGTEFGLGKIKFSDFTKYSKEQEEYCVRDVEICHRIYDRFTSLPDYSKYQSAIKLELQFQLVVNALHNNGFCFDRDRATRLLHKVTEELEELDAKIREAFPPRQVVVREFTPKATKFGTISKTSVPRSLHGRMHEFEVGKTYPLLKEEAFNPSSHKQLIEVLHGAEWQPVDKTKTFIEAERALSRLKYSRNRPASFDIDVKTWEDKIIGLQRTGWKINEANLSTLPPKAPEPARLLAKRIMLESRRRTLTEWLKLVQDDGRIRGKFVGIGAWTHRMAHQAPNTANIPNELDTSGKKKLLGKEMRQLWRAPRGRLLVGVDAEGIQLRIFAHIIDDVEFTFALVQGKKDVQTDPHSLNQRVLGSVCKSRAAAKRFIYALLLGAGIKKLSEILECSDNETREALNLLLRRYEGFALVKKEIIPKDARRGWFTGLDGRKVRIPGAGESERKHLAMSGYLQNGEAIVMKKATLKWHDKLAQYDARLVNLVHDEWQTECPNDVSLALEIAKMQADSLREVGEELGLKCPLAGSYMNDHGQTIGTNWYSTH